VLREGNLVNDETLALALAEQEKNVPRRSLGRILIDGGFLGEEEMRSAIKSQVEGCVIELAAWKVGSFEFVLNEIEPVDDIFFYPGDLVPEIDLNTQVVLLEAARIFDERSKNNFPESGATPVAKVQSERASDAHPVPPATPTPEGAPYIQIVSGDDLLTERLRAALAHDPLRLVRVPLREAGSPPPGEVPPIVVLDLRSRLSLDSVRTLRRARPRTPLVAVVDSTTVSSDVYRAGAIAALPPDAEVLSTFLRHLPQNCGDLPRAGVRRGRSEPRLAKLRRIFSDLRNGAMSSTIALSLMTVIAESLERAVLFLVQGESLVVLGAFGYGGNREPLSRRTRGHRLSIRDENAVTRCLADARARVVPFAEAALPGDFAELLGPPRTGQAAFFPVMGGQRVIAVIYGDNAASNRAIEEIDILELAMMQVGLAFENELLRRKAAAGR
jgi:hypothetical protein